MDGQVVLHLTHPAIIDVFHQVLAIDIDGACGTRTRDSLQALVHHVDLIA